ncbi:MAG TPA: carboxypeptidase regulatory-like domain-containing protein [Kofleriaceae bacterium]|nr:carboxypeptidase regulatory-like domain-containing protein [Kofleriaceae bacterium]
MTTLERARGPWSVLLMVLLAAGVAQAEDPAAPEVTAVTTAIHGVVRDGSGAGVVGATVVASSPVVSGTAAAITDDLGRYTIAGLPPGAYEVHVYYGDGTWVRSGVAASAGLAVRVDVAVDTSAAGGEVIVLDAKAPGIDPTSTTQGVILDTDYTRNMPVPGRTFEHTVGVAAGSAGDGLGVSFSGSSSLESAYIVDGVNTSSLTYGTVGSADQAQRPSAGLMTAATVGDADRFSAYLEFLDRHAGEAKALGLRFDRRLRVTVADGAGRPINDVAVTIDGRPRGRTHADGIWDFVPGATEQGPVTIEAGGQQQIVALPARNREASAEFVLPYAVGGRPIALDLAFAIDATGSMGDEMRYLSAELADIVARIRDEVPGVSIRVGGVIYRDRDDAVPLAERAFSSDIDAFVGWLNALEATGGGDYPEDMNSGLHQAMTSLEWRTGNVARILVVLADAPPKSFQNEPYRYPDAIRDAAVRGIRLLPVAASGADRTVEYLFRAMGVATSTPYVYLTDDSGIGNPHLAADTDQITVERFNELLLRLVVADLRGEGMHPPGDWQSWSKYRVPPWQDKPRRLVLGAGTGGTYLGELQRFAPLHWVRAGIAFGDFEVRVHLAWSRDFVTRGDRLLMRTDEAPTPGPTPLTLVPGASLRYLFGGFCDVRAFTAMGFEALHAREPARAGEALLFTSQAGLEWQPGRSGQGLGLGLQVASHLVLGATTDSMHALPQLDVSGYVDYRF